MSALFQPLSQEETLQRIQERLSQDISPADLIAEMLPQSHDEVLAWGRRLAVWDEHQRQYPAQVIALARVISQRSLREHGLMLREDGRVVDRPAERKPWKTPPPAATFRLRVAGEELKVAYTPGYFPNSSTDLLSFLSSQEPPRPHALSETGYLSRFVPHDTMEACGGPQAYAALLADALLRSEETTFTEALEGRSVEAWRQLRQAKRPGPESGEHAKRVMVEEEENAQGPPRQGLLF